jgi:hypothetical protein
MTVRITHIRFEDGASKTHETIAAYAYVDESSGATASKWKPDMVAIVEGGKRAFVGTGSGRVEALVVKPDRGQKYLRTVADGKWSNNLLSLPTF